MSEVHSMGLYPFPSLDENIFHRLYEHPCQVNMVIPLLPVFMIHREIYSFRFSKNDDLLKSYLTGSCVILLSFHVLLAKIQDDVIENFL